MRCVRNLDDLERYISLKDKQHLKKALTNMRMAITPHTLTLINFDDPCDPLLLMSVPQIQELDVSPDEFLDPIGDEAKSPIPFLTHRYQDRVLVYVTFSCAQYCRFCFRRRKTGRACASPTADERLNILTYLREHPIIEEAILTGGDPFILLDNQLDEWLKALQGVPSIRRLRIHTRVPVTLPSRITPELVRMIRRRMKPTFPINIVTHFNHPNEIASENVEAVARLIDAGILVRNQSVLLKGVNDDAKTLEALFKRLVDIRVVPYYLHQLDRAQGISHFRVPMEEGISLMRQLQGKVTGIALPRYMLDRPGGKGKVQLAGN